MLKINVGCGTTPTPGFINLDNSLSALLASVPLLGRLSATLPVLAPAQRAFVAKVLGSDIRWAPGGKLPFQEGTVAVVYSSHMLEHLSREEARTFLTDVYRVLMPGGWVRIAVPDLNKLARRYLEEHQDADQFVESIFMSFERPPGLLEKLKMVAVGPRHHLWMYDGASVIKLLVGRGFERAGAITPGQTNISDPGALDLSERADESVYIEAQKPL